MTGIKDGVHERLREERERIGLSQAELAERVGFGRTTQHKYESGEASPALPYLIDIAKHGLDVQHILFNARDVEKTVEVSDDFKRIQECFDLVGFFLMVNGPACPDHQRWAMVEELFKTYRSKERMNLTEVNHHLRTIFDRLST